MSKPLAPTRIDDKQGSNRANTAAHAAENPNVRTQTDDTGTFRQPAESHEPSLRTNAVPKVSPQVALALSEKCKCGLLVVHRVATPSTDTTNPGVRYCKDEIHYNARQVPAYPRFQQVAQEKMMVCLHNNLRFLGLYTPI